VGRHSPETIAKMNATRARKREEKALAGIPNTYKKRSSSEWHVHLEEPSNRYFTSVLEVQGDRYLGVIDNVTDEQLSFLVLEHLSEVVSEELFLKIADEWYTESSKRWPLSFELCRLGYPHVVDKLLKTFCVKNVKKCVGKLFKYESSSHVQRYQLTIQRVPFKVRQTKGTAPMSTAQRRSLALSVVVSRSRKVYKKAGLADERSTEEILAERIKQLRTSVRLTKLRVEKSRARVAMGRAGKQTLENSERALERAVQALEKWESYA